MNKFVATVRRPRVPPRPLARTIGQDETGEAHDTPRSHWIPGMMRRGRAPIWLEVLQFGLGIALLGISLQNGRWLFVALAAFYLVLISFRAVNSRRKPPGG